MPDDTPVSRETFDELASRLGLAGSPAHMDELFNQVQGVLAGTRSLLSIDVSDAEPDMAFRPAGGA